MKISFLFIVLVLFPSAIISTCDVYKCSESSLKDNLCEVTNQEKVGDETRIVHYLDNCSSSKSCMLVSVGGVDYDDYEQYGICIKVSTLGHTGDKCKSDAECYSKICNDKKCEPKSDGSPCSRHQDCDEESACIYNEEESRTICKKLLAKGDKCHYTDECPFNTVCTGNKKNEGTCVDYFSLGIGETSYDNRACASGQLDISNYVCAEFTVTDSKCEQSENYYYYCISSMKFSTDQSVSPTDTVIECQCKPNGEYACPPLSDSESFKNYVEVYKKEIENVKIEGKQVSSMSRDHWNNKKIREAFIKYDKQVQLDGADECVEKKILSSNHLNVYMLWMIALLSLIM